MKRSEEILRNKAYRDLKKKKIYSIEGSSIHEVSMELLHSFYKEKLGKILTNRSRKFTENNHKGFIYLMETSCKSFYKIGFSNDPNVRLATIQTGCPLKINIVNFFKGSLPLEKILHNKIKSCKVRGEWYKHSSFVYDTFFKYKKEILDGV